jgi:hypothetical protein
MCKRRVLQVPLDAARAGVRLEVVEALLLGTQRAQVNLLEHVGKVDGRSVGEAVAAFVMN